MNELPSKSHNHIGVLHESSFHSALKKWYSESEDLIEVPIDNFLIDLVRDGLLIEIQTKNFASIRKKLEKLIQNHNVRLVHPIIQDKWITSVDTLSEKIIRKRLSPKGA